MLFLVLSNNTPIARRVAKTLIRTQKQQISSKTHEKRTRSVISKISKHSNPNLNPVCVNLLTQNSDKKKKLDLYKDDASKLYFIKSEDLHFELEEISNNSNKIDEFSFKQNKLSNYIFNKKVCFTYK